MRAFITGACGQDGYYLCQVLSRHEVFALYRGQDEMRLAEYQREFPNVQWVRGDVTDSVSLDAAIEQVQPDWVFNMAAASYVGLSWQMPKLYMETNCGGVLNLLESVRRHRPGAHVIQASTSEMYGPSKGILKEDSPMHPVSPYGISKLAAHELCRIYRQSYNMHVSCAISFNHESPRRPPIFVTRKVTRAAAKGLELHLGNSEIERDWGFAGDYVQAYILMAQAYEPDDYVVATGITHSLGDLTEVAFEAAGIEQAMVFYDNGDRPVDIPSLWADPSKIERRLGWRATTTFRELITIMVEADREKVAVG